MVAVAEAIDADAKDNGRVTYSILGNNPDFSIDAATGAIHSVSSLKSKHNLTVSHSLNYQCSIDLMGFNGCGE